MQSNQAKRRAGVSPQKVENGVAGVVAGFVEGSAASPQSDGGAGVKKCVLEDRKKGTLVLEEGAILLERTESEMLIGRMESAQELLGSQVRPSDDALGEETLQVRVSAAWCGTDQVEQRENPSDKTAWGRSADDSRREPAKPRLLGERGQWSG